MTLYFNATAPKKSRRGINGTAAANAARRLAALPRWYEALRLRESNLRWREVAARLGVDVAQAHRMASEAEAHRISVSRQNVNS
jgi:hypothetical protein